MYELAFTNPDLIFEQREVNVLYTSAVFENLTFAIDAYKRVSNPIAYPDSTTREAFMLADFANVDEVTLFFGEDINDLGMPAISYTLIFRHKNLLFVVIVSAPVDSYDDNYAMQMKNRLRKAVIYYSSFILEKIPVSSIADIPLPPFGEFSLVTNTPEVVDDQYESIIEQVYTPKPPPNAIFADNFENSEFTHKQWEPIAGEWQVVNGTYYCKAESFWCLSLAGSPEMQDYTFSVDIMGSEGVDKFIYVGAIENQKYYQIKFRSDPYNDLLLSEEIPGLGNNLLRIVQIRNTNGRWYHLDVVTKGKTITIYVDNLQVMFLDNPKILGFDGKIGVGLQYSDALGAGITSVFFDNVIVFPTP